MSDLNLNGRFLSTVKDPDLHFALIFCPLFRAVNSMPCNRGDMLLLKGKKD